MQIHQAMNFGRRALSQSKASRFLTERIGSSRAFCSGPPHPVSGFDPQGAFSLLYSRGDRLGGKGVAKDDQQSQHGGEEERGGKGPAEADRALAAEVADQTRNGNMNNNKNKYHNDLN